jgi:hypothetical protein
MSDRPNAQVTGAMAAPPLGRGATLWLAGAPLRALRNRGTEPAVLVAVSRRNRDPRPASRLSATTSADPLDASATKSAHRLDASATKSAHRLDASATKSADPLGGHSG